MLALPLAALLALGVALPVTARSQAPGAIPSRGAAAGEGAPPGAAAPPPGSPEVNRLRSEARRFAAAHPRARLLPARHGGLEQATGLAVPPLARDREESARRFLARDGAAFGIADAGALATVRASRAPGRPGSAVFERRVEGLRVFGGRVSVGWRADGTITSISGSSTLGAAPRGRFRLDRAGARAALAARVPAGRLADAGEAEPGWLEYDGALLPVFRVDYLTRAPFGAHRAYVDGERGAVLYALPRLHRAFDLPGPCPAPGAAACISAYENSPLEPARRSEPLEFVLRNVAPAAPLVLRGSRTAAFNCRGAGFGDVFPAADRVNLALCSQDPASADGSFVERPRVLFGLGYDDEDPFAAQSAYFHIDRFSAYVDQIDPDIALDFREQRLPGTPRETPLDPSVPEVVGFVPGFVNLTEGGAPLDNAFFSPSVRPAGPGGQPSTGIMAFGQGAAIDTAYDAEILYHELTHAVVERVAELEPFFDAHGINVDPASLNEGTADTFAFTAPFVDDPCLSKYFGSSLEVECLRQARNQRTCRGNGPNDGRNPGRDGEIHDDGEIWSGFTWALYEQARRRDEARCATAPGGCTAEDARAYRDAMVQALFRALVDAPPRTSFAAMAELVREKIGPAFEGAFAASGDPALAAVAGEEARHATELVTCVMAQRDLSGCAEPDGGRAVALFSGERAFGRVPPLSELAGLAPAPQQYFVDVPCGAAALRLRSGSRSSQVELLVRRGEPARFAGPRALENPEFDWRLPGNRVGALLGGGAAPCPECEACVGRRTPLGAGRWYFLVLARPDDAFELGVTVEMADGSPPPRRVRYGWDDPGAPPDDPFAGVNACRWGVPRVEEAIAFELVPGDGWGPAPRTRSDRNPAAPPPAAPPELACAAPAAPTGSPEACSGGSGGCGCTSGGPASVPFVLAILAWAVRIALRRRRSTHR